MPRPYQRGQRQVAVEQTRSRIISAAHDIFAREAGVEEFTVEAVARQADVARMTVYYQFGSKTGLLEALCDSLAGSGGMEQLSEAFRQPDPLEALDRFILIFSRFWDSDRLVTRRLRGLAALDPELEQVIRARDERRHKGLGVIIKRITEQLGLPVEAVEEPLEVLHTLTSFETFDTLAGPTRKCEEVAPVIQRLARFTLGFGPTLEGINHA